MVTGVLGSIILLATVLRVLRLDFQPLWWDEGYSVWFATHPLSQMAALTAQDIHPPLYYALLHGWIGLLGPGPAALRLLSIVFGTVTIPTLYLAGRLLFPGYRRVAFLAALLLATNPMHVFYSQEVRMYGLMALLSPGILAAAWRVMAARPPGIDASRLKPAADQTSNPVNRVATSSARRFNAGRVGWSALLVYIFLTAAALYTQYYAVFLPIGLTLYALWHWRRAGRALARWLGAQLVVAVLYLPWALYAAPKLIPYVSQKVVADADKPLGLLIYLARHLAAFLVGHLEGPLAPWWPVTLMLLVPIAIGSWLHLTRSQPKWGPNAIHNTQYASRTAHSPLLMLATVTLTALALGWLISLNAPFFPARGERLLILALPAFVLLVAAAVVALWIRWRSAGYVILGFIVTTSIASLAAFYTVPRYVDDDYRSLIAHVSEQGLPEDTVYCVYPWQVGYWRSYAPGDGPTPLLSPKPTWGASVVDALDAALARGRVWFPAHLALGAILETQIEARLGGQAVPFVNEWHGANTRLSAWVSAATNPTNFTKENIGIRFAAPGGGLLVLETVAGSTRSVPAANAVTPVVLAWQADVTPPVLAVSLRLIDDLGQIWAQHDYEPLGLDRTGVACNVSTAIGWCATDRLGLLIPAGTPPGRYHIELVLRPKGDGRAIDALALDGRVLGPTARLFDLDVTPADRPLGPERLPIAAAQPTDLDDNLRFLGFSTVNAPLVPGDLRKVSLFWEARGRPTTDYVAFVQVLGRDGAPVALWEAAPGAAYPTTQWEPGTLIRTQAGFRVPASVSDGRYRLIAGLFRASDKALLRTAASADHLALGTITLRGRRHDMTPPQPQHSADATFSSVARLTGYDLVATETQPGGTLALTLHWQALAATDRPYTVFVHLLDEAGTVWGYGDAEPGRGAFPTPGWLAGEYLADEHTLSVAADTPAGTYQLAVGFYDPASGERPKTAEGTDQIALGTAITIR